jgi:hypothetical protein
MIKGEEHPMVISNVDTPGQRIGKKPALEKWETILRKNQGKEIKNE